ncbi:hypothetical protein DMUE_1920 [Dictyocoela muelleri]|nr:hypothetical protein DMUE_1920 [Dictyocoela muelleri]
MGFRYGLKKRETKYLFVKNQNKKSNELLSIIYKKAFYGTILYGDCFQSYCNIDLSVYNHENHDIQKISDILSGVHTQSIEANWSAIRRNTPKGGRLESENDIYNSRFIIIRNLGGGNYTIKSWQTRFLTQFNI